MRKIQSLRELQMVELELLLAARDICRAHGLRYFLAGGTLLGAIRHRGFIPWDNDVDIAMPRRDYERFLAVVEGGGYEPYALLRIRDDNDYVYPFAKLVHTGTAVIETGEKYRVRDLGVFLDIFPIDGMPEQKRRAERLLRTVSRWVGVLGRSNARLGDLPGRERWKKAPQKLLVRLLGREACVRRVEARVKRFDFDASPCIASTYGLRGVKEILPRSLFAEAAEVEFEGHRFDAPIGYDGYLRQMYGSYWELPPEERRTAPHELEAYWKEQG